MNFVIYFLHLFPVWRQLIFVFTIRLAQLLQYAICARLSTSLHEIQVLMKLQMIAEQRDGPIRIACSNYM